MCGQLLPVPGSGLQVHVDVICQWNKFKLTRRHGTLFQTGRTLVREECHWMARKDSVPAQKSPLTCGPRRPQLGVQVSHGDLNNPNVLGGLSFQVASDLMRSFHPDIKSKTVRNQPSSPLVPGFWSH